MRMMSLMVQETIVPKIEGESNSTNGSAVAAIETGDGKVIGAVCCPMM